MCICVCVRVNNCSDCQDCQNVPETICLGQELAGAHVYRSIQGGSNEGKEGCDQESAVKYFSIWQIALRERERASLWMGTKYAFRQNAGQTPAAGTRSERLLQGEKLSWLGRGEGAVEGWWSYGDFLARRVIGGGTSSSPLGPVCPVSRLLQEARPDRRQELQVSRSWWVPTSTRYCSGASCSMSRLNQATHLVLGENGLKPDDLF